MYISANYSAAQTAAVVVSCPPGQTLTITKVSVYVSHAVTVDTSASIALGSTTITGHPGIAAGSGFVESGTRDTPIAQGAPGESITFTCSAPTTGSVTVNITYDRNNA